MFRKMSPRLQALVTRDDGASELPLAAVKVRLRSGLDVREVSATLNQLERWIPRAEYVPISGTVHGSIRLRDAENLENLAAVESIDLENSVPVGLLIDR